MTQKESALPRLARREACTGCTACRAVCPREAIALRPDGEGFLRPVVDAARCVRCGACERACPVLRPGAPDPAPDCFAARVRDLPLRLASSSGGVFTALARPVLAAGGVVFGVVWERPELVAIHAAAEDEAGLAEMCGSKYVQSDPRDTFREARAALRAGRRVLYSGTPCQIAGLLRFLGRPEPNLLTVEIICHGAPSPAVFERYKAEVAAEHGKTPVSIASRNKHYSWRRCSLVSAFADTSEHREDLYANRYLRAFLGNLCLRPSCHRCQAKEGRSGADVTIADFWGVEKVCPALDDDRGTSAVLLHTEAGRRAWAACAEAVEAESVALGQIVDGNPSYLRPVPEPSGRAWFMAHFRALGLGPRVLRRALGGPWPIRQARRVCSKARRLVAACRALFILKQGGASSYLPSCLTLPAPA